MQNSLCVQGLHSPILAPAVRISQTLRAWYKEWNYRTFAEGATYIFGWAAITLGIGPHF